MNYKRIIESAYVHQDKDDSFVKVTRNAHNKICFDREVVYDLMSVYQSRMMFYLHACNVSLVFTVKHSIEIIKSLKSCFSRH